jgi:hypothetical protein
MVDKVIDLLKESKALSRQCDTTESLLSQLQQISEKADCAISIATGDKSLRVYDGFVASGDEARVTNQPSKKKKEEAKEEAKEEEAVAKDLALVNIGVPEELLQKWNSNPSPRPVNTNADY